MGHITDADVKGLELLGDEYFESEDAKSEFFRHVDSCFVCGLRLSKGEEEYYWYELSTLKTMLTSEQMNSFESEIKRILNELMENKDKLTNEQNYALLFDVIPAIEKKVTEAFEKDPELKKKIEGRLTKEEVEILNKKIFEKH